MPGPPTPQMLSSREAAEVLGLTPHTVTNYLACGVIQGELIPVRGQMMWVISRDEINRYRQARDAKRGQIAYNKAHNYNRGADREQ